MVRAPAAVFGLFAIWLLLTQRFAAPQDFLVAALAALLSLGVGLRFGRATTPVFGFAPQLLLLGLSRAGVVLRGAISTLSATLAADVSLTPALARLKTRSADNDVRAELANLISAAPGAVVVDTDAEGVLMHLLHEDAVETAGYAELEAKAAAAFGARAAS
jgi:multisubunit Na+/H+ antiporter MnhE subunit